MASEMAATSSQTTSDRGTLSSSRVSLRKVGRHRRVKDTLSAATIARRPIGFTAEGLTGSKKTPNVHALVSTQTSSTLLYIHRARPRSSKHVIVCETDMCLSDGVRLCSPNEMQGKGYHCRDPHKLTLTRFHFT
jgi:hypothetical protein